MISPECANHLRENHDEVIRRWLENLHGHIAEDFEHMLRTPMGSGVANKLLSCAVDFLEAEDYLKTEALHSARDIARDASFRRTAVGFCLPDIVTTALAFRAALEETVLFHAIHRSIEDEKAITDTVMELNQFGDVLVAGEIAGFFSYNSFKSDEEVA
ncbi:MAG: hypothetical protein M1539_00785 [Actinobacteria bacterium]|nr:hypothetical protein [Actinomycetota bacterium]MCL5882514.1 hypothetical protein [Actinomycetota bacterium]